MDMPAIEWSAIVSRGAAVAYGHYEIALVLSAINFATLRFMNPFKTRLKDGGDERNEDGGSSR